ncbi:hypothetical protein Syun_020307 [Stephania yunnanensis]|uniref:GT-1/4-like C-terminal domain-containing protein n=1 Tax=Stephania yunnanensis TaxID=152371 RepID=A0AAP0IDX9_9MAGN
MHCSSKRNRLTRFLFLAGGEGNSYGGRVITVKWGDFTRRIGIDGTADAIKEAIKSAFGLRTRRAFWLEDEDEVVRSLDRDMPLGTYTLHLDEGITIKLCIFDESDRIHVQTEEKTFYTEENFRDLLAHRGWTGLRELSGFRSVDSLNDIRPGAISLAETPPMPSLRNKFCPNYKLSIRNNFKLLKIPD